ncbi:hypothetical protein [Paenibacillus planticolens]|uniref:Uncharacterized protein n=1 Tax=Paenibacillus planticolens TaxID=2654976 RepID=A0ABX1ZWL5_9BACL|nr:hypothetical protein [Paenibacillus planticolens]NOV04211.1 hypothetical protein [Paenibacillus planticolens]
MDEKSYFVRKKMLKNTEREQKFISFVQSLCHSKSQFKIEINSHTLLKEFARCGIEIEGILIESAKAIKLSVDDAILQAHLYNGYYTISDFVKALIGKESSKTALKQMQVCMFIAYALAILAIYNLFNVNIVETWICSSIGSSMYLYCENKRRLIISMMNSGTYF